MMLGDWFSGEDAVRLGLANEVVAPEELMARAYEVATDLTTRKQVSDKTHTQSAPAPP